MLATKVRTDLQSVIRTVGTRVVFSQCHVERWLTLGETTAERLSESLLGMVAMSQISIVDQTM